MAESVDLMQHRSPQTESILDEWTTKMTEVLTKVQTSLHPPHADSLTVPIGIKLDGSNYALWSQVNAIVKGWLINSMDPSLIDSIATTFFYGTDTSQVCDLHRRVTRMRQTGGSIEKYSNDLQGLWREIDFRRPNPMKCVVDIQKYNSILQEERVNIFLDGLDDRLDNIWSDVPQLQPFPTVEQAYAHVRWEDIRQTVMTSVVNTAPGAVMASKGIKASKSYTLTKTGSSALSNGKSNPSFNTQTQSDGGKCTHCGNTRHTRETCFKLHGYPDWWNEFQTRKKREGAASNEGTVLLSFNHRDDGVWIIDSRATDHITFDPNDFSQITPPRQNRITNANGVTYPVTDILTKEIIGREPDVEMSSGIDMSPRAESILSKSKNAESKQPSGNESPRSSVPEDPSPENIPEVSSPTIPSHTNELDTSAGYVLPFRHNRGKPPNRYSPDIEEKRSKYPIANYVSEMNLFSDNKAAIDISHNPVQHDRTKHVEVDRHFIKQNLEGKIIQFHFVKSEDQLANILTKAVSSKNFYNSLDKLCIRNIYAPT
ncbi:hypothetical protein ACOSP7_018558 [Xanthoceras sorbifolium]